MNATPTKKERIYVHLNKSTRPWTCEIRSELDDSILASGLAADGYQDHTSSADIIVRAVNSYDAMRELINQNDDLLAELSQYVSDEHMRLIAEQRKRNNDALDRIEEGESV